MTINRNFYRHSLSLLLFLFDQQHRQPAPLFDKPLPQIKLPEHDEPFLGKPGLGLSCSQALDLRPKRITFKAGPDRWHGRQGVGVTNRRHPFEQDHLDVGNGKAPCHLSDQLEIDLIIDKEIGQRFTQVNVCQ